MHRRSFLRGLFLAPVAAAIPTVAVAAKRDEVAITVNGMTSTILDGTITARSINVTHLSAISANLGTFTVKQIDRANEDLAEAMRSSPTPAEQALLQSQYPSFEERD
jgi:hypothetical protein